MAVTIRTKTEALKEGLKVPEWVPTDDFLLGHDDDDGALMVWGPGSEHHDVARLAKAYA